MQSKIRLRGGYPSVVWDGWHREASPIPIFTFATVHSAWGAGPRDRSAG
jgi:hypothetical protein